MRRLIAAVIMAHLVARSRDYYTGPSMDEMARDACRAADALLAALGGGRAA